MKKTLKVLLSALVLSISICSFPSFAVTRAEALEYVNKKVGTTVGNGQCVAFAKDYYSSLFGENVHGNGSDYINNVPDGFTQYRYGKKGFDPQPGDIVSWSWNKYGGNLGHVGIITKAEKNGFYYLHQNPDPIKESFFTYGQKGWTLAGVVRPPFDDDAVVEEETTAADETAPTNAYAAVGAVISSIANEFGSSIDFENGSFSITSAASGKRMNVYVDKISQTKNGTTINLYKAVNGDKNDTQQFVFEKVDENTYLIQPRNSSFTVNVSSLKSGSKVICWTSTKKNNEPWIVEPSDSGEGYTLRLQNQPDMYLTQSDDSLVIKKKSGKKNQIFNIE